jgi:hypothetical protein
VRSGGERASCCSAARSRCRPGTPTEDEGSDVMSRARGRLARDALVGATPLGAEGSCGRSYRGGTTEQGITGGIGKEDVLGWHLGNGLLPRRSCIVKGRAITSCLGHQLLSEPDPKSAPRNDGTQTCRRQ